MTLPQKLERTRILLQLSPPQIAAIMGVSAPTYRRYESGAVSPPTDALQKLATYTGLSVSQYVDNQPWPEAVQSVIVEKSASNGLLIESGDLPAATVAGGRARRLRRVRDLFFGGSVTDMAARAGLSKFRLSDYLNEKKPITDSTLQKVATGAGVSLHWLKTGEGDMLSTSPAPQLSPGKIHQGQALKTFVALSWGASRRLADAMGVEAGTMSSYYNRAEFSVKQLRNLRGAFKALGWDFDRQVMGGVRAVGELPDAGRESSHEIIFVKSGDRGGFIRESFRGLQPFYDTSYTSLEKLPVNLILLNPQTEKENHVIFEIDDPEMGQTARPGWRLLTYLAPASDWTNLTGHVIVQYKTAKGEGLLFRRIVRRSLSIDGMLHLQGDAPGSELSLPETDIVHIFKALRFLDAPID